MEFRRLLFRSACRRGGRTSWRPRNGLRERVPHRAGSCGHHRSRRLARRHGRAACGCRRTGAEMMQDNADLLALVRTIPDFPKPGIQFRDITTLIHNGWGLRTAIDRMATASAPYQPTLVAGIEEIGTASCRERGGQYV